MFQWAECHGCDEFENQTCKYCGKYWECPYAEAIQEDINREEDF